MDKQLDLKAQAIEEKKIKLSNLEKELDVAYYEFGKKMQEYLNNSKNKINGLVDNIILCKREIIELESKHKEDIK